MLSCFYQCKKLQSAKMLIYPDKFKHEYLGY